MHHTASVVSHVLSDSTTLNLDAEETLELEELYVTITI